MADNVRPFYQLRYHRSVPHRLGKSSRTKSGKVVELAVRDVVHERDVNNTDSIANPEALDC